MAGVADSATPGLSGRLRPGGEWDVREPAGREALIRAAEAGDQDATDVAWAAWLAGYSGELRRALARPGRRARWQRSDLDYRVVNADPLFAERVGRRRRQLTAEAAARAGELAAVVREHIAGSDDQALADEVCELAVAGAGEPELAAWCVSHGLAPADPVRRAVFFMLTGQAGQHRAADPDGSLLTLGYQAATDQERDRIRAAVAEAGELELIRVVQGGGQPRLVSAAEVGYLVPGLAGRQDWPRLWQLVQNLPLAGAVAAVRVFGDGWRPAREPDQSQFAQLAEADPERIASARAAVPAWSAIWSVDGSRVYFGSISPDGCQLALAFRAGDSLGLLDVVDLPGGAPAMRHELGFSPHGVLHLGESVLVWSLDVAMLYAGNAARQVFQSQTSPVGCTRVHAVVRSPGGFAAYLHGDQLRTHVAESSGCVRFWDTAGQVLGDVPAPGHNTDFPVLVASDPGPGRLAFSADGRLWIVDADPAHGGRVATVVDSGREGRLDGCFAGPDRLVTSSLSTGAVQLWHTGDGQAQLRVRKDIRAVSPAVLRDRGVVAVASAGTWAVQLLDLESLETLTELTGLTMRKGLRNLWAAPSGSYLAVCRDDGVSVADISPAAVLASRPLAAMTAADLALAAGLARDPGTAPLTRYFAGLLRDFLAARFGGEVALGTPASPAGADDVGLAAAGENDCQGP